MVKLAVSVVFCAVFAVALFNIKPLLGAILKFFYN